MSKLHTVNATSPVGGKTADLKNKFTAGSIPLDTDFSELIDIAECGRRAVGQSADQSDNSVGAGLVLAADGASMGKLAVLPKASAGITVDASGVGIDQSVIFPKGMIMMFYDNGTRTPPPGWSICDGNNGTPDLTAKFVMGGNGSGETNNKKMSGDDGNRQATGTAKGTTANISGNKTNDMTLTTEHLPNHTHDITYGNSKVYKSNTYYNTGGTGAPPLVMTPGSDTAILKASSVGGGKAHNHGISQTAHTHDVSVDIPYYTLMYIMKL